MNIVWQIWKAKQQVEIKNPNVIELGYLKNRFDHLNVICGFDVRWYDCKLGMINGVWWTTFVPVFSCPRGSLFFSLTPCNWRAVSLITVVSIYVSWLAMKAKGQRQLKTIYNNFSVVPELDFVVGLLSKH